MRRIAGSLFPRRPFHFPLSRGLARGQSTAAEASPPLASSPNPLLDWEGAGTPPFDRIRPSHLVPAIEHALSDVEGVLDAVERGTRPVASWEDLAELDAARDAFGVTAGVLSHLAGVQNSDGVREAEKAVRPRIVQLGTRWAQSEALFRAHRRLREDATSWNSLSPAAQRVVSGRLRDAELAGVHLEGSDKATFNALQVELARLSTEFTNHLLDSTKAFQLVLREEGEVAGLTQSDRQLFAQAARASGMTEATAERGPWAVTLDGPSFVTFMQRSEVSVLRERLYTAFVTRASQFAAEGSKFANEGLVCEILARRQEMARLLGKSSFAEVSLARKMAGTPADVVRMLEDLRARSLEPARAELAELSVYRAGHPELRSASADWVVDGPWRPWDVAFWSERFTKERYSLPSEAELQEYFPLPAVLDGLFDLVQRLFGVSVRAADGEAGVWHPDVRFFRVEDRATGRPLAAFFLDPYSRPASKRGGAWMDVCLGRGVGSARASAKSLGAAFAADPTTGARLPVAYLVCNGSVPVGDQPSCLRFSDVVTLAHELGHGLQHMLTTVDVDGVTGIRGIEWDAIELPSQFMENWCYHPATLRALSCHVRTGASLPPDVIANLRRSRKSFANLQMLRQLYFGRMDMDLHLRPKPEFGDASFACGFDPFAVQREVAARYTLVPPLERDRFLCSFSHIFAGGYAAGYYSYKFAEVMSADAFAAFAEEAGGPALPDEAALARTGRRFRDTVLALGGSEHPRDVFRRFRGRDPTIEALVKEYSPTESD